MKKLPKRLLTVTLAVALAASALFMLPAGAATCSCHPRELGEILGSIHVLNTGWEDAIVLQSDGYLALIDAAEPGRGPYIVSYLQRLLAEEGQDYTEVYVHLEFVIGTHSHIDHFGGFPYIFSHPQVTVGRAYLNYEAEQYASSFYRAFVEAALANDIPMIKGGAGVSIDELAIPLGHMTVTLLNAAPLHAGVTNPESIVQLVEIGNFAAMLASDMNCRNHEAIIWAQMSRTAWGQNPVDFLKVGHHGLLNSTGRRWANNLRPTYAVYTNGSSWVTQSHDVTLGRQAGADFIRGQGGFHNLRRVGTQQFVTTDNGGVMAVFGTTGMELRAIGEFTRNHRDDTLEWWHDDSITLTHIAPPTHNFLGNIWIWWLDHWHGLLRRWGI
ncbi:MAG: MBL fold metallo-hydrolase [Oscillospiraceae bacterium]|nr:MBL fold metallo-hydrolase [Oscillospiraceae bacterium]